MLAPQKDDSSDLREFVLVLSVNTSRDGEMPSRELECCSQLQNQTLAAGASEAAAK